MRTEVTLLTLVIEPIEPEERWSSLRRRSVTRLRPTVEPSNWIPENWPLFDDEPERDKKIFLIWRSKISNCPQNTAICWECGKNPDARKTIFSIWRTHVRLFRGQEANHRSLNRAPLSSPYPGQWRPRNLKSPMEDNLQRRTRAGLTSLPSPLATTIRRRSLGN